MTESKRNSSFSKLNITGEGEQTALGTGSPPTPQQRGLERTTAYEGGVVCRTRGGAHWVYRRASWWRWCSQGAVCVDSGKAFPEEEFDLIQEGRSGLGQFLKTWREGGEGQSAPTCHCEN